MSDNLSLKESFSLITDWLENDDIGPKAGLKGLCQATFGRVANWLKESPKKLASWTASFGSNIDDNIDIPTYTKTLTGDDFSSLLSDPRIVNQKATDGSLVPIYKNNSEAYSIEMICNFSEKMLTEHKGYDILTNEQKVAYETVLLTKKYGSMMSNSGDLSESYSAEYAQKMNAYKNYCAENNIDWDNILHKVSNELQYESCVYADHAERSIVQNRSDANRVVANKAHRALLSYAGEDFDDTTPLNLSSKIDYAETLDIVPNDSTLGIGNVGRRFTSFVGGKFDSVKSLFTGVTAGISDAKEHLKNEVIPAVDRCTDKFLKDAAVECGRDYQSSSNDSDDYDVNI